LSGEPFYTRGKEADIPTALPAASGRAAVGGLQRSSIVRFPIFRQELPVVGNWAETGDRE